MCYFWYVLTYNHRSVTSSAVFSRKRQTLAEMRHQDGIWEMCVFAINSPLWGFLSAWNEWEIVCSNERECRGRRGKEISEPKEKGSLRSSSLWSSRLVVPTLWTELDHTHVNTNRHTTVQWAHEGERGIASSNPVCRAEILPKHTHTQTGNHVLLTEYIMDRKLLL